MEIDQKERYLVRIKYLKDSKLIKRIWVEEVNYQKEVYDKIQRDYGFHNEINSEDEKEGILGVRLISGELP